MTATLIGASGCASTPPPTESAPTALSVADCQCVAALDTQVLGNTLKARRISRVERELLRSVARGSPIQSHQALVYQEDRLQLISQYCRGIGRQLSDRLAATCQ